MASAADIAAVRIHTNEKTDDDFTDEFIGTYLDTLESVNAAAAAVWWDKAAKYADLVDSIEAGVNHQFSQLHRQAIRMAELFEKKAAGGGGVAAPSGGGVRVNEIERSGL